MDTSQLQELTKNELKNINGGLLSWGGYIAVAAGEIVDVITSGGNNLKQAYQNGLEAGRS